jgi:hypothetical protein
MVTIHERMCPLDNQQLFIIIITYYIYYLIINIILLIINLGECLPDVAQTSTL